MTDNEIRTLALVNGFSLRQQPDGTEDINPYVFAFARQLLAMENARCVAIARKLDAPAVAVAMAVRT